MNTRIIFKSLFYIWETLLWGTGEHDGRVKTTISTCMPSHVSHVWLCVIPSTAAHQTHSSTGFSRQQYWSGFSSVQFSRSVMSDSLRPMNHSTPGLPVHHHLPEFTQTQVNRDRDAIQPSHPGSYPSPPVPNPSQNQSLLQWVNSSHEVAKVLEFQL